MRRRGFIAALAALPFVGKISNAEPRHMTVIKSPWISAKTGEPVADGSSISPRDVGHFIVMDKSGSKFEGVRFFDLRTAEPIDQPAGTRLHVRERDMGGTPWVDVHLEWT